MTRSLCSLAVLALTLPVGMSASARTAPTPANAVPLAPVAARLLAAHNRERAVVGAPPLQWDLTLVAAAAGYAPTLAYLGRLTHSPKAGRPGQSENLWMGPRGRYAPEQMVGLWAAEKAHFRAGLFPAVSRTGDWNHVSHYTQMIWPRTTRVGCAIYSAGSSDYLVCRYSPKGNQDNQRVG